MNSPHNPVALQRRIRERIGLLQQEARRAETLADLENLRPPEEIDLHMVPHRRNEIIWMCNHLYNRVGLFVEPSKLGGYGLFTDRSWPCNAEIVEYNGQFLTPEENEALPDAYDKVVALPNDRGAINGDIMYVDDPNIAIFANDPGRNRKDNAFLYANDRGGISIFSDGFTVKPGEKKEILLQYGKSYWEGREEEYK